MGTLSMEVIMASEEKPATVAVKTGKAGGKASGVIAYNPNMDTWLAVEDGQIKLTGAKVTLVSAYPNFAVKE